MILKRIKEIFDRFFNLIFPNQCPFCGKIIPYGELKCSECEKNFDGLGIVRFLGERYICVSAYPYSGKVRDAVRDFKFRNKVSYSKTFAQDIVKVTKSKLPNLEFSAITYVPLSKERKKERGYNQSKILAREIADSLKIPLLGLLHKTRNNAPQHNAKDKFDRILNVREAYSCEFRSPNTCNYILLCDDIVTTGNTLLECLKVLDNAGFKKVICVTIASTALKQHLTSS